MQNVVLKNKESSYAVNEQIKYLRSNIQFCGTENKVILATSSQAGEGKSSVVLALGKSFAEMGKKVLIVDADLRRSVLNLNFVNPGEVEMGMTYFLSGLAGVDEVICNTNMPMLDLIVAGPVPPNPSELLASARMKYLLQWARTKYDYVFVDSAPLGLVIDAAVVAPECDASILVLEAERIPFREAQGVVGQLQSTGCPILGVVLTKVNPANNRYMRYAKYDGKYGDRNEHRRTSSGHTPARNGKFSSKPQPKGK